MTRLPFERIREDLIEAGRDKFASMGLERTRVADLTDEVGIGTSTFYKFFDSKGTLYLTVLNNEAERFARSHEEVLEEAPNLQSEVRMGLEALYEELETNPLFYRSIVENERQLVIRKLSSDQQLDQFREPRDTLDTLPRRWTQHPNFRLDDPDQVVVLLQMLSQTVRLREQFETLSSISEYENARDVLVDVLVYGLVDSG